MQNLGTLRQLSLGDLADDGKRREEEEREIMPSLMATSLRWRTHSARTNGGIHIKVKNKKGWIMTFGQNKSHGEFYKLLV
jgi:hypothetical protein